MLATGVATPTLFVPDTTGTYVARALPIASTGASSSDCPSAEPRPGGSCGAQTSCSTRTVGGLGLEGFARTADGTLYVARLEGDWTTRFDLATRCLGGSACFCQSTASSTTGLTTLHISRVTATGFSDALVLPFDRAGSATAVRFAMSARGTTLRIVAPTFADARSTYLFLEVDTTRLR